MDEATPFSLKAWESFYVIVGSSAGALTGLQFVVLTLITEGGALRGSSETLAAFGSPNVVHFCAALLISAIFSAPWDGLGPAGVAAAICGALGFLYCLMVLRRTLRQKDYKPVLEDWTWHAGLPLLAYAGLIHAGIQLQHREGDTLYVVGGATLLLVFIGIHNAWDTVTYVTIERSRSRAARRDAEPAATSKPAEAGSPARPAPPQAASPIPPAAPPASG